MPSLEQQIANHFRIDIRRKGQFQNVRCPFHNDSNPSAGILFNREGGLVFNCLTMCGAKGMLELAQRIGLSTELNNKESNQQDNAQALYLLAQSNGQIKRPLNNLRTHVEAYARYMLDRNLNPDVLDKFGGQYINNPNDPLYGYVRFIYGRKQDHYVARRILDHDSSLRPRFLNDKLTKEINLMAREQESNKLLFNGENIRNERVVLLCEGITDLFTLYQMGYTNVVASLGAEANEPMLLPLRGKTVFIIFDTDYAGYKGARSAYEILKRFNANPIILELPDTYAGDTDDKIDVNSAYCKDSVVFSLWLREQIGKYSTYDNEYVISFSKGKVIHTRYFSTGIPSLDKILCGGYATGVHVIAGETGSGKSTIITHASDTFTGQGASVLVCSYELPKEQIYARYGSRYSQYNWQQIEQDMSLLEPTAIRQLMRISNQLRVDNGWSLQEIAFASDNFDIIIVDYIQRMTSQKESKKDKVEENMEGLSNLAIKKNKVILVVSSIGRQFYGGKPALQALKESGGIEFVAQSVLFASKFGNENGSEITSRLSILKNTRGQSETDVYVKIDLAHQRIADAGTLIPAEYQMFVK